MKNRGLFEFDPHKSFIQLPVLWIVVSVMFLVALVITVVIVANSDLHISLDYQGFNGFVSIFKVPLGFLALIIPIVALLAANHRSEQTKAQIVAAEQQNNFSNYFKHLEEFEKYVNHHKISLENNRATHKKIFPNAYQGDISIGHECLQTIEKISGSLVDCLRYFSDGFPKTLDDTLIEINRLTKELEGHIGIAVAIDSGRQVNLGGSLEVVRNGNLQGLMWRIKTSAMYVSKVLQFDQNYIDPPGLSMLCDLEMTNVPSYSLMDERKMNPPAFSVLNDN